MATGVRLGEDSRQPSIFDRRQRGDRRPCKLQATLATDGHETLCRVINIAEGGFGLHVDCVIKLRVGQRILVNTAQLGNLAAVIRWASSPTYGAEFTDSARGSLAVKAFYDQLPSS